MQPNRGMPVRFSRPSSTWAMSLLFAGHAVRAATAVAGRGSTPSLVGLLVGLAVLCSVVAVAVYLPSECPRPVRNVLLVVAVGVVTVLVATAHRQLDVVLSAFAYPWIALYAAHFVSRRGAFGYAVLIPSAFGVGIAFTGLTGLFGAWVMVSATTAVVTFATSALVAGLHRQSETDPLTGVANRAGFHRLAAAALATPLPQGRSTTVVVCDIDGLKQVNDTGGHAAGDALLVEVVAAWTSVLRRGDLLARIGGDEFALLLSETDQAQARDVVRRLHAATSIRFSSGIASWQAGDTVASLLARADAAMYDRKRMARLPRIPRPVPIAATS